MHYDFVPPSKRNPLRWPDGKRLAVTVTLNLEYWDMLKDTDEPYYAGGPPAIPDPVPGNILDVPNFSWREYGQRVGIWRLFDAFDGVGVPASCTVNAKIGLERRDIVDAVLERGWELVAHNYEQGDLLTNYQFDKAGEEKLIKEALKVFKDVTGRDSKGWLSSSLRSTSFYLQSRGLDSEGAISLLINGYCKDVFKELPLEFSVEAVRLLEMKLEGSVG